MKNDEQGYILIAVIWIIIGLIVATMINNTRDKEKAYEYALNGEIGHSSKCYLKNDIAKCIVDKKIISVDNFYEVEK